MSKLNKEDFRRSVLNLVINGLPSILQNNSRGYGFCQVLNLVINGLPSIPTTIFNYSSFFFI